jgi:uncharacterized protein DUF2442
MTTLVLETEPIAVQVMVTEDKLTIDLADGRSLVVPLTWYPRLVQGSRAERQHWQLLGDGYAIEWPDLDEHGLPACLRHVWRETTGLVTHTSVIGEHGPVTEIHAGG